MPSRHALHPFCAWRLLLAVFCLLLLGGCSFGPSTTIEPHEYGRGVGVVKSARSQIGVRYKRAGHSPSAGFDCSGLVWWAYDQHGLTVPRITSKQLSTGTAVSRNQMKPGDIVLFRINKRELHSGIYSGKNMFIHSPKPGSRVREDSMDIAYWKKRYLAARRPKELKQ